MDKKYEKMNRRKFIKKMGGAAVVGVVIGCSGSCTKMDNPISPVNSINPLAPEDVDFILDLTDPLYSSLSTSGNFIIHEGKYVVARAIDGEYIAATRLCSHEALYKIQYMKDYNSWVCDEHGAAFDLEGNGDDTIFPNVEDPSVNNNGLTIYNTELIDSSKLRVFS